MGAAIRKRDREKSLFVATFQPIPYMDFINGMEPARTFALWASITSFGGRYQSLMTVFPGIATLRSLATSAEFQLDTYSSSLIAPSTALDDGRFTVLPLHRGFGINVRLPRIPITSTVTALTCSRPYCRESERLGIARLARSPKRKSRTHVRFHMERHPERTDCPPGRGIEFSFPGTIPSLGASRPTLLRGVSFKQMQRRTDGAQSRPFGEPAIQQGI